MSKKVDLLLNTEGTSCNEYKENKARDEKGRTLRILWNQQPTVWRQPSYEAGVEAEKEVMRFEPLTQELGNVGQVSDYHNFLSKSNKKGTVRVTPRAYGLRK